MSWDAYLYANDAEAERDDGISVGDWNYTHNTNGMIVKVIDVIGVECGPAPWWDQIGKRPSSAWWDALDGLNGADGEKLLTQIVNGLMEAPELFRAMDPENGWGSYDTLLPVLVEMRERSARFPEGEWSVHG